MFMLGNYPKAFFVTDGRTGNAILKRVMAKYPDWPKNVKLELSPCGYIEAVKYHIGQNGKKYGTPAINGEDYPYGSSSFNNIAYHGKLYKSEYIDGCLKSFIVLQ